MQIRLALGALVALMVPLQTAQAAGTVSSGDTAWLLMCSSLVMLMVIPGLAMFYGGLVRTKNTLSMFTQVFAVVCLVALLWAGIGYSLVYTSSSAGTVVGGLSKAFLRGVTIDTTMSTGVLGADVPELVFIMYQMAFASVAPAILVGAFAERMRFPALIVFVLLWTTLAYFPLAHMAWFAADPSAVSEAARAVSAAASPAARSAAEVNLQFALETSGLMRQWGGLDFAGGTAVHVNAGIAGLVAALVIGHRVGYGRVSMAPHNLVFTLVGGALLWIGWLGFNGGSALRANGVAGLALVNTVLAAAAAAASWTGAEWALRGKPSALGLISGAVAGLVAVTPAAGYASPAGAMMLGIAVGAPCLWFSTSFKARYQFDDALDVFGVHFVAGVIGTLAVALLAHPGLGGTGVVDLVVRPGQSVFTTYDPFAQLIVQAKMVIVTIIWSSIVTVGALIAVDRLIGLRTPLSDETRGLDITDHGERAYNS
jgi:ammonium transporter, Amt family